MHRRTFLKGGLALGAISLMDSPFSWVERALAASGGGTFQIWFQWQDPNADFVNDPALAKLHVDQYSKAFRSLNEEIATTGRPVSVPIVNPGCPVAAAMGPGSFWTASLFGDNVGGLAVGWDGGPSNGSKAPAITQNLWGKVMEAQNTCGVNPINPDLLALRSDSVFGMVMQLALEVIPGIIASGTPQEPQPFVNGAPVVLVNTNIGSPVRGFGTNVAETVPPIGVSGVPDPGKPFQLWIQWRTVKLVNGQKVGNAAQKWVDNMDALVQGLTDEGMHITAAGCSPVLNYGQEDNYIPTIAQKAPNSLNGGEVDPFLFWTMSIFGFDGVPSNQSSESLWNTAIQSGAHPGVVGYFLNLLHGTGPLSPLLGSTTRSLYAQGVDQSSIVSTINVSSQNGLIPDAEMFLPCAIGPGTEVAITPSRDQSAEDRVARRSTLTPHPGSRNRVSPGGRVRGSA